MTSRIIALDVGDRRIGVAVSDPLGLTAQPLETIERHSNKAAVRRIVEMARSYGVREIVVGVPYSSRGEPTAQAHKVLAFAQLIEKAAGVPVIRWDERHTTVTAERTLLDADVSRAKRKLVRDKMAAAVMLQDYLETERHQRGEGG
ncbi:MAG: Holliday junction resolvase RuvX [Armatimonadota bacterium]|nr:MAG: Holliday junction resolvase RuvX [Armatimonadota bacterium]